MRRACGMPCEAEARRLWAAGEAGRAALWNRLAVAMGPAEARAWLREFEGRVAAEGPGEGPQGSRSRRRSAWISQRFLV